MKFNLTASHVSSTACILLLGMSSLMSSAAYAVSDACCITQFPTCGCIKQDNGDWIKGWGIAPKPAAGSPEEMRFKAAQQKYSAAMKAFTEASKEFEEVARAKPAKK